MPRGARDFGSGIPLRSRPQIAQSIWRCAHKVILISTSSKAKIKMVCNIEEAKGEGTMEIEALNPEHVKGTGDLTATDDGKTLKSHSTFNAKWHGSNCGNVRSSSE